MRLLPRQMGPDRFCETDAFGPSLKDGQACYVTLSAEALQVLNPSRGYRVTQTYFPQPSRGARAPPLHFLWVRIRKRAGLKDVRLHDLRHSFASALINRGERRLHNVQRLLGHENSKSTQRYAHLAPSTLSQGAGKMGQPITTNPAKLQPSSRRRKPRRVKVIWQDVARVASVPSAAEGQRRTR